MTDIKARKRILNLISYIWKYCPHQRFLQLLINIVHDEEILLFYMEDEHLEKLLNNYIDKYIGKKCPKKQV